jgi:trans-aconitate 2-methyltransferase
MTEKKDWSATQYLKFSSQRTRAVHDLVNHIAPLITFPNPRIYDLGCGPGNSTKVLLSAFPRTDITGMDTSADMLAKARAALPAVTFELGDVEDFQPPEAESVDLIFSNAVFHWLRSSSRIHTLSRIFETLRPGGVLAIQVPNNYHEPSHVLMRSTALLAGHVYSKYFADAKIGDLEDGERPDLDPIEPASAFYNALVPDARDVDIWETRYEHVLKDAGAIVEWVKGTGLQPYLERMGDDEDAKSAFLKEYERGLKEAYPALEDGKVMLGYPRLFVVAVRK